VTNFENYTDHTEVFKNIDAAFFCIGAYTGSLPNDDFKKITVDYAIALAKALSTQSPQAKYCLLSGAGADNTEKSRTAFAKYKGMAENQISKLNLAFYSFRPGYIYPVTKRKEPNFMYAAMRFLYPVVKLLGKKYSIKSTDLAQAMVNVAVNGSDKQCLENEDIIERINKL
jgi:uncharacterized protein YbjT (DUF2867 family)